jgi:hypothetical protein
VRRAALTKAASRRRDLWDALIGHGRRRPRRGGVVGFGMSAAEVQALIDSKPLVQQLAGDPEATKEGPRGRPKSGTVPLFHANEHASRSAERLVRRLKRDRPDIAEALARGHALKIAPPAPSAHGSGRHHPRSAGRSARRDSRGAESVRHGRRQSKRRPHAPRIARLAPGRPISPRGGERGACQKKFAPA